MNTSRTLPSAPAAETADAASTASTPAIGSGFRLQWEPAQKAYVLLYAEGMVTLNASAGAILSRCDGQRSVGEIVADLESCFEQTGLGSDVLAFLRIAEDKNWVNIK
ncbi:MAG: pyrroloquinoline quinone biosynthesis peptide chaperone PqqD [Sinobacteraceae bacterium]|nr:pyrroloquinoline quinone biosynthesis peptide chaperone PqqD [Nevskiaceae bacterium]